MYKKGKSKDARRPYDIIIYLVVVAISLIIRLINIDVPLLESSGFRQTQTAFTVQTFIFEGISLWNYSTPVLGYPYKVPFEFPVFQFTAYLLHSWIGGNLDLALRFTNIAYFYVSAYVLYLICKKIITDKTAVLSIVAVYLMSPYSIFWSRTAMIDFCSVAFGMAYLLMVIEWIYSRSNKLYILTLAIGAVAYLSKATSMLPMVVFLVTYIWFSICKSIGISFNSGLQEFQKLIQHIKLEWSFYLKLVILLIVPISIGYMWVVHSDAVKTVSGQEWLTSRELKDWNYGTIAQKLSPTNWGVIGGRIAVHILPWTNVFFLISIIFTSKWLRPVEREISIISGIAAFSTVLIFFNLYYIHEYYMMAIIPFISIVVGVNIKHIFSSLYKKRHISLIVFLVVISGVSYLKTPDYFDIIKDKSILSYENSAIVQLGQYVKTITKYNENIIITDYDWSSEILYYCERKGLMLRSDKAIDTAEKKNNNFKIIMTKYPNNYPLLLSSFQDITYIKDVSGFSVYAINDGSGLSNEIVEELNNGVIENSTIHCDVSNKVNENIDCIIEKPAPGIAARIQGWGFIDGIVSDNQQIFIKLTDSNNKSWLYTSTKVLREDVGNYFDNSKYNNAGFDCILRDDNIPKGKYTFKILISGEDQYYVSGHKFEVSIE